MRFAESIRDPRPLLVDRDKLANLMIQHGVGIQTKEVIKISKIDLDFFSGGGGGGGGGGGLTDRKKKTFIAVASDTAQEKLLALD